MQPYKPNLIITNCPGCPMFLDRWQYVINEMEGKRYGKNGEGIPVFTYEEVEAWYLVMIPGISGLQMHQTECEPVLEKMGIAYSPEDKFKLTEDNKKKLHRSFVKA